MWVQGKGPKTCPNVDASEEEEGPAAKYLDATSEVVARGSEGEPFLLRREKFKGLFI